MALGAAERWLNLMMADGQKMANQCLREGLIIKTLRLMFEIEDGLSWQPRSQWRDLKFDSKHHTDIYKLAIVGRDQVWRDWVGTAFSPMKIGHILKFSSEQKPLAKTWLER